MFYVLLVVFIFEHNLVFLYLMKVLNIFSKIKRWEEWPFQLLYAPISIFWIWYTIKSGSCWFFTPSNPKLTFGGMEGEPKKEMYDLLPTHLYPVTFYVSPHENLISIKTKLAVHQIKYPFIVKPAIGEQGILLRKIEDESALKSYHDLMPWDYIVQDLVYHPMELSVFYIRNPNEKRGMITGFLHKISLHVIGNGKDDLASLIVQHPKGNKRIPELFKKHGAKWDHVLESGEIYMLSYAANHNRGAQFIDLKQHIDDKLLAVFDDISLSVNDFFYGRYDIMCTNIPDLKLGKNFTILEFNGCGAEPNHFYDNGYTLINAYREILKHWKALYQISKYNSMHVVKPWPFIKGLIFFRATTAHKKNMKKVDANIGG